MTESGMPSITPKPAPDAMREASINAPELPDILTPPAIDQLFARGDLYTARAVFARLRNFGFSLERRSAPAPSPDGATEKLASRLQGAIDFSDKFNGIAKIDVALLNECVIALRSPSGTGAPVADKVIDSLRADLKMACPIKERCSCADGNWQWYGQDCANRMARATRDAILSLPIQSTPK